MLKIFSRLSFVLGMFILFGGLALSSVSVAAAQQPAPNVDDEVLRISKDLYCPVCVGVPLDVCETQACVQWRALIREKLLAGASASEIRAYFIAQYGERVLGAPPPEGFNLSVYLLPLGVLALGAIILFFTARGWLGHPAGGVGAAPASIPPVSAEYAERIARELKARE